MSKRPYIKVHVKPKGNSVSVQGTRYTMEGEKSLEIDMDSPRFQAGLDYLLKAVDYLGAAGCNKKTFSFSILKTE